MSNRRIFITGLMSLFFAPAAFAQKKAKYYADGRNTVMQGFDVVAYQTERKAKRGKAKYSYDWDGARWHFSSESNRKKFASNPKRWVPQYGGWCAEAMAYGRKRKGDPYIFRVYEGKLYTNLNMRAHKNWLKDMDSHIKKANKHWPRFS